VDEEGGKERRRRAAPGFLYLSSADRHSNASQGKAVPRDFFLKMNSEKRKLIAEQEVR
jgi:hypothetical protein